MNKKNPVDEEEKKDTSTSGGDEGGDSGTAGGTGTAGGAGWVPSYYELLGISEDEQKMTEMAAQALFEQRISVKSQGYDVTALSKMQKLRNQLQDPSIGNGYANDGGSSLGLEEHPELAEMGGDVDPNNVVLPESELAAASNDPKLQNKLRNRLAAKFGMSSDLSLQTLKAEYEKKMKMQKRPAPEEQPRYRPTNAPKYRPY